KKNEEVSLKRQITDETDIKNTNNVKVITEHNGTALYYSRSVIQYQRDKDEPVNYFQHIGVNDFRTEDWIDFYRLPMCTIEAAEKLEQLRYLEYGKKIRMIQTSHVGIGIDTPEDLERARKFFS